MNVVAGWPLWRLALFGAGLVALGYIWGQLGPTRGIFPYPQIVSLKDSAMGPDAYVSNLEKMPPSRVYRQRAEYFAARAEPAQVVIIGDSLLARLDWRDWLPGVEIANRAIPGDFAAWIPRRIEPILATQAKDAVLMIGINDAVLGRPAGTIHRDILKIVKRLDKADMAVTVLSPLPCTSSATKCNNANAITADLHRLLTKDAGPNARYVDIRAEMAPGGALIDEYADDGLHLNARGIAELLRLLPADLKAADGTRDARSGRDRRE